MLPTYSFDAPRDPPKHIFKSARSIQKRSQIQASSNPTVSGCRAQRIMLLLPRLDSNSISAVLLCIIQFGSTGLSRWHHQRMPKAIRRYANTVCLPLRGNQEVTAANKSDCFPLTPWLAWRERGESLGVRCTFVRPSPSRTNAIS